MFPPRHARAKALAVLLLFLGLRGSAAILHVWDASPSSAPPYDSWDSAARTIQAAIDYAAIGDTVLVTNGVYASGAVISGGISNRVFINKAVRIMSVNGPNVTSIVGAGGLGLNAVRCVYLADGASLSGFTLTNGFTASDDFSSSELIEGGGAWCQPTAVISNCVIRGNMAHNDGGGVKGGTVLNSWLDGNSARDGGGADRCTLINCTISNNRAEDGGGVDDSVLYGCFLINNSATQRGGAAFESTFYNCTATGNSANRGGAVAGRVSSGQGDAVYNSILYNNHAPFGANYDPVQYSVIMAYTCTTPLPPGPGNISADPLFLSQTRVSTNSPCLGAGSAMYASGLDIDGQPWRSPPSMGADEIQPGFVIGPLAVSARARYTNVVAGFLVAFDATIDGAPTRTFWSFADGSGGANVTNPRHPFSSIGSYPVTFTVYNDANPAGVSATVIVTVASSPDRYVNKGSSAPAAPFVSWSSAAVEIQQAIESVTVAGTVIWVTNGVYDTGGNSLTNVVKNRVALRNAVRLRSLNGPEATVIKGGYVDGFTRCAYVGHDAILNGFTLTGGTSASTGHRSRDMGGGGAWAESTAIITNCLVVSNYAYADGGGVNGGRIYNSIIAGNVAADDGGGVDDSILFRCVLTNNLALETAGGADESILENCILSGNTSWSEGGGADGSVLLGCVLSGNTARWSGSGASDCYLYNCTIVGNVAEAGVSAVSSSLMFNSISLSNSPANHEPGSIISYSCTTPLPVDGVGNIEANPGFVNLQGGDFRLTPTSPCIDRGVVITNFATVEFSGTRRSADGNGDGISVFDMGAFEFVPVRPLSIARINASTVRLSWPGAPGVTLQRSDVIAEGSWTDVPGSGGQNGVNLPLATTPEFFRLLQP